MSKSNSAENSFLLLVLQGTAWADLAENDSSSPATNLYLSLHTADPGEAGNQSTNECAYTSYARKAVARTSGGFTVSGNTATLAANQDFVQATGGSETATHFGLGTASSGAGVLLWKGAITPNIVIANGTIPRLTTGTTITED